MYERFARRHGIELCLLDVEESGRELRSCVVQLVGKKAHLLRGEGGAHKIQHLTRSRRKERIHTSVVTVSVMEADQGHRAELKESDVSFDYFRGSGPGGQHRNVTDSGVRATHAPTGTQATITRGRSQIENKRLALILLESRVREQAAQGRAAAENRQRRKQIGRGDRAGALRVYDEIRDVVRCENGQRLKGVARILGGQIEPLLID